MTHFEIAGESIAPGTRKRIMLQTAALYDFTSTGIPVEVIHGKKDGPVLFVSAAIHGDEINGVEIVKRLLRHKRMRNITGTLIAIPIINVFGFNTKTRYLPDRRDLNRTFPGSESGSLASQVAHVLMKEVVSKATHGVDLHTAAIHRNNLPQVRGCFDDALTKELAESFGVPVMIHSALRDGSMREAARQKNIPMLIFEGGEALRFTETVTRCGVRGVLNVMEKIGMIAPKEIAESRKIKTFFAHDSHWLRAPSSGIMHVRKRLGAYVKKGQILGVISDPFGAHNFEIKATHDGIIIGMSMIPLFNKGDAAFHVATFADASLIRDNMDDLEHQLLAQADTFVT